MYESRAVNGYSSQPLSDVLLVSAEFLELELDALERLATEMQDTRVIILTSRKDTQFLEELLRCGAKGIFQREWPIQQIPKAIRKVTGGGVWLEQAVADGYCKSF